MSESLAPYKTLQSNIMSNYKSHAWNEFKAVGWITKNNTFCDEFQEQICTQILELLEKFSEHGHSGTTAPYAINLFSKLAAFEPLGPLTGEDWEWNEVSPGTFQNKRCGHVFKDKDRFNGQAYDIDGKIFWEWYESEEDGKMFKSHFTNGNSAVPVTFPYTPKREYVFVPTQEFPYEQIDE